ncbi:hypothetical protein K438DRAFT_2014639 [Mycena galopus ATCC 62051]|nr:hypothetical protein K438DRAFT_2014639 [Mycena galopus ATCC 62051]
MKRVAEDIDRDSKRPRHENCGVDSIAIFRDPIHEKTATELLEWTPSEPGYICGQICMKWPAIKDKHRIKMEMFSSADGLKQFEELKLSLKGAAMEKASSRGINLPITLKYGDGVALAILPKGQEPEITIDTWFRVPVVDEPSEVASAADDWFTTPIQPRSPVLAAAPAALMDVDEEPTPVVVSPPSEQKAVSKLSVAPKTTRPPATVFPRNKADDPAVSSTTLVPHGFTPISGLEAAGGRWNVYSIIGIVTYIKPAAKTKIGDWGCSLRIVDPSICDESYRPLKEGDVIILRDIKTLKNFDNITASGYWDKFQWAVYDSTEGQIKRPSLPDGVPKSGNLADGFGAFFTPFCDHTCTKDDLRYCVTLDEWWRGVQAKRREALGTIHQIEETSFVSSRPRRKHRLISELTTTGEYFDFTVRVVHGYPAGHKRVSSFFADRTLQIEMWDEACLEGPSMLPGEHYLIKNVRLKRSNDGYPEGKLVEAKIYKLERDDESPNLKALLERLQPYDNDDVEESKLKLIKDAEDKEFMSYVVELLHRDESLGAIYVTDYTAHPKIPAINEPWALGLDGRVLKIALFDEQPAMNQHLVVGQYYTILNLRLQASSTAQEFRGTLGGSGRFIIPINPKSSAVGDWKESLIQRKHQLKQQTESLTEIRPDIAPQRVEVSLPQKRPNCLSIKEVLASTKCPRTFFVRAKVVDFFPFKLNDSFKRTCANCNTFISDNRLACFKCDDVEKEYVKIVSILRFEINDGDQALQLSVSGNIPLLKGIEPTILHDDPEAARQFANRMRPLLHNLEAVHDGILSNEEIEPECPEMTLIIDNWEDADKKMMYGLRDYEA